jgi:lipopolysaccharide/colanic/teichoic acid biosynthesis glycosyltransferase
MRRGKRVFDLTGALVGLALLWPLLAVIAVVVKASDGGPVFFRQERVGYRGRRFQMWKFRTMGPRARSSGIQLTVAGDPRITRVGRWLRHLKLDELPQLFNVLAGEMSLVGPRPEVPRYVATYTREQRRVLELVPGVTDVSSIAYRRENELLAEASDPERAYMEHILPEKIRLSLEYAAGASVWRDFLVILETIKGIGRGGDDGGDNDDRRANRSPPREHGAEL